MTHYEDDLRLLREHATVLEFEGDRGARVAVVPEWQGRVATSTTGGGESFGWLNRDFIASDQVDSKIHAYGGEDRIWIGPEGGQFSIFNDPGDPFDVAHWRTPAAIDTDHYEVVGSDPRGVSLRHETRLRNWSNTEFDVRIERAIRVLGRADAARHLGFDLADELGFVAFESTNTLHNIGANAWTRQGGTLALWIIGMFRASDRATVVVPFERGDDRGPVVNDRYFGAVPADRLVVGDAALFFRGDAQHRSKLGVGPRRAKNVMGSFDDDAGALTVVHFDVPTEPADYVNQMWEQQADPFDGDVIHSYNDGVWSPDRPQLGRFYELEASSPAAFLEPGQKIVQGHRTMHFKGAEEALNALATSTLGVDLATIRAALP